MTPPTTPPPAPGELVTAAAVGTGALVVWVVAALLTGLLLGATAAPLLRRRPRRPDRPVATGAAGAGDQPPPAGSRSGYEVDDLPGFLEHPPGSAAPAEAAPAPTAPAGTAVPAAPAGPPPTRPARRTGGGRHAPAGLPAGRTLLAMAVTAVVLVLLAALIALVGDGDGAAAPDPRPASAGTTGAEPAAPPPGDLTARAAFGTVLLERRPAGVTVTRPGLRVSSTGERAAASVLLPTYNCLLREPPPDPEAAGCARAATEYAELSGPALELSRDGDRVELAGQFATYTRPRTGPPEYTGRSYRLSAVLAAAGPELDGVRPATGELRLGAATTATTGEPGATVLELPR